MQNVLSLCERKAARLMACIFFCLALGITILTGPLSAEAKGPNPLEGQTVLLDFTASWCGPCQRMTPIVDQLVRMGYPVRKVDIDREPALAKQFGIQAVPTFVMLVNGREANRVVGGASLDDLVALCQLAPRAGSSTAGQSIILASNKGSTVPTTSFGQAQNPSSSRNATPQANAQGSIPPLDENCRFAAAIEQDLIAVTVRIRIDDPQGRSTGSGTIIDARGGEALIVTCGHLFRESQGKTPILVDIFGSNPVQGIPAQLIYYDDKLDIGFLSIRPGRPVVVARVASPGYPLAVGDNIYSVGCSESQPPSVWDGRITAIDKYLGPSNIEASRAPLVGRSGGGLFSNEGFLIGVCNAADPPLNEGIYLALREIHHSLDQLNLAFVYRWDSSSVRLTEGHQPPQSKATGSETFPAMAHTAPVGDSLTGPVTQPDAVSPPRTLSGELGQSNTGATPEALTLAIGLPLPIPNSNANPIRSGSSATQPQKSGDPTSSRVVPVAFTNQQALSPAEKATLEEILRRQAMGYDVVCVVQSADQPVTRSEIIVVRSPSSQLLAALNQAGVTTVMPGQLAGRTMQEAPADPFSARLGQVENDRPLVPIPTGAVSQIREDRTRFPAQSVAGNPPDSPVRTSDHSRCVLPAAIVAMPSSARSDR